MPDNAVMVVDIEAELDRLAKQYRQAGGMGLQVLNLIGSQAETLLDRLPKGVRSNLNEGTETALRLAMKAANGSRDVVSDQPQWLNTLVNTTMGAVGGAGGLPTALAELPVTTTILLRSIQGVASDHGFDPAAENVQFDCIEVFAVAGPLESDDGADLAFLTTRMALTGVTVQTLIARVAPKLAIALGQKLAAQTVPVLGAVAGAATNYAYTTYYQKVAGVHFGLRKLAIDGDIPREELVMRLKTRLKRKPLNVMGA